MLSSFLRAVTTIYSSDPSAEKTVGEVDSPAAVATARESAVLVVFRLIVSVL
jgi:hypothetical protein